jgi:hypothetical protein
MTCTSTGTASMPWNATVRTRATIFSCPRLPIASALYARMAESCDPDARQAWIADQIKNIS